MMLFFRRRIRCAFYTNKNSDFNFRTFPVAKGTAFSRMSDTVNNLASYTQISKFPIFSFGIAVPFDTDWFRKLTNFTIFPKLFLELSVPFATFSNVPVFLFEWEAPLMRFSSFSEIPESDVSFVTGIIRKITLEFVLKKN